LIVSGACGAVILAGRGSVAVPSISRPIEKTRLPSADEVLRAMDALEALGTLTSLVRRFPLISRHFEA
jgi:hypothetical protein